MAKGRDGTETEHGSVMEQKIKKELRFLLTSEEKNKMANEAARISKERDEQKAQFDILKKAKNAELKQMQKDIDRLLGNHLSGSEVREVDCTERLDWETKTVTYLINNEVIETREMHDSELQMKLNTNPTAKNVKKEAKKPRSQKDPEKHLTPEEMRSAEIAEVHQMETRRGSKKSSIDPQHDSPA